eukprot:881861-Pelagomonas_calceolata.AAC.3
MQELIPAGHDTPPACTGQQQELLGSPRCQQEQQHDEQQQQQQQQQHEEQHREQQPTDAGEHADGILPTGADATPCAGMPVVQLHAGLPNAVLPAAETLQHSVRNPLGTVPPPAEAALVVALEGAAPAEHHAPGTTEYSCAPAQGGQLTTNLEAPQAPSCPVPPAAPSLVLRHTEHHPPQPNTIQGPSLRALPSGVPVLQPRPALQLNSCKLPTNRAPGAQPKGPLPLLVSTPQQTQHALQSGSLHPEVCGPGPAPEAEQPPAASLAACAAPQPLPAAPPYPLLEVPCSVPQQQQQQQQQQQPHQQLLPPQQPPPGQPPPLPSVPEQHPLMPVQNQQRLSSMALTSFKYDISQDTPAEGRCMQGRNPLGWTLSSRFHDMIYGIT